MEYPWMGCRLAVVSTFAKACASAKASATREWWTSVVGCGGCVLGLDWMNHEVL